MMLIKSWGISITLLILGVGLLIGTVLISDKLANYYDDKEVEIPLLHDNVRTISNEYVGNPKRPEGWEDENAVIKTFHYINEQHVNLNEYVDRVFSLTEDSLFRVLVVTKDSVGYIELHPIGRYTRLVDTQ